MRSRRLLALLDDDRLAREVAKGNEAAFEVVYDRHHRGLLSFCRHLLGSPEEAEDALQQTFASAYYDLMRTGGDVRLKAWLYTIARNRCISTIRARHSEPSDEIEPATAGLHEEVEQRADLRELLADLQRLSVDQRSALILSELKGMSHRDVAEVLQCDVHKVKALVFQARSHLLEFRTARHTPCAEIRQEIAVRRRGAPSGAIRRHVAVCEGCAEFRAEVQEQRRALGLLLPVLPAAGLRAQSLALVSGGSAGSSASGGVWLASHAQLVKLASLGVAAITAAAVTVPLVTGGSRPARAGDAPAVSHGKALWPVTTGGHARGLASGGLTQAAAHAKAPVGAQSHAAASHRKASHRTAPHRHHHARHAGSTRAHVHHRAVTRAAPLHPEHPHAPSGHHGGGHAYGHLHAPGWLRHHGGGWPQGHDHGRRHDG